MRTALTQMKNTRKYKKSGRQYISLNPVHADDNAMRYHDFTKVLCVIIFVRISLTNRKKNPEMYIG